MLDARAIAVGEQVTPTGFRPFHCPALSRGTPTERCNPTQFIIGFVIKSLQRNCR